MKPMAFGAYGRPKRIWMLDTEDFKYERGEYRYR